MGERHRGTLVSSSRGYYGPFCPYILVFKDLFTKYVELKALRKADAKNILKAFDELVVHRWGCPQYHLTENGTEFSNKLVTERLTQYGIIQTTLPPYHAQANPVERVNRILKSMMATFLKSDHKDWDLRSREFGFALNSMEYASNKISPAYLNFGRQPEPRFV